MHVSAPLYNRSAAIADQFKRSLERLWKKEGSRPRLGLAVSGGVDSMALASLCSENAQVINRQTPLVGFIVDHKLREGSTQEARNVAEELRRLRIEPRVLTLDWKHHGNPSTVEHLEHLARKLRFQAIGRACSEYGIESLLVAHHADDQAETVLMRIVGKYFGSGLRGIGCSRPIPECQGIYGVDQSGSPRLVKSREPETTNDAHEMLIEDGGVSVLRPLLSFTKEELTEYCKAAKVRWFEDRTNADPKFALRNTIRHLQKNDRLPVALRRKRLVAVAVRATKLEAEAESSAQDEYDRMGVSLDVRTGIATFDCSTSTNNVTPTATIGRNVHTALLRKLLSLVAPTDEIKSLDAYHIAGCIWPETEIDEDQSGLKEPLQVASVTLTPPGAGGGVWTMVRQVPSRRDAALQRISLSQMSTWQLWDGRYWIRICQRESGRRPAQRLEVSVRFLRQGDLAALMKSLNRTQRPALRDLLALAPGNLRFTLPVLVARGVSSGTNTPDSEQVVALPSLGWSAEGWDRWPGEHGCGLESSAVGWFWDIRYKKVHLAHGGSHQILARLPDIRSSRN